MQPQLADFGLARILTDGAAAPATGAGTVTHLAPELLARGGRVTPAADAYAFGILLWECYTQRRAFAGMSPSAVRDAVLLKGARPAFPPGAPPALAALAAACAARDPAARPAFNEVVAALEGLLAA